MLKIKPVYDSFICIKGEFGGVSYYMTSLSLDKVADSLHFEKDLNIINASFAERIQRTLNQKRAEEEIYKKYLLNAGTRFFNSLVVSIIPDEEDEGFFEIEHNGENIYTLKLKQNVKKVVVDGQHRLYALRKLREDIIGGLYADREDLKKLQIPIIFVIFNKIDCSITNTNPIQEEIIQETRRVFTALNKTAKKIDKYTTLILDDSDFSAIVARKLLEENIVNELYVKWAYSSTSLNQNDVYFTTLNILNDMIEYLEQKLKSLDDEDLSTEENSKRLIKEYFEDVVDEIGVSPKELIKKFFEISFFKNWIKTINTENINIDKQPNETKLNKEQKEIIKKMRDKNILAQVVGQKALFGAIVDSLSLMGETPNEKLNEVYKRAEILLKLDIFKKTNDLWKGILVGEDKKGKMIAKQQNIDFAKEILLLLLTYDKYDKEELNNKIEELNKLLSDKLGIVNRGNKIREIINELRELKDF
jgi:DGQHR domain-containing protein